MPFPQKKSTLNKFQSRQIEIVHFCGKTIPHTCVQLFVILYFKILFHQKKNLQIKYLVKPIAPEAGVTKRIITNISYSFYLTSVKAFQSRNFVKTF